MNSFEKWWLKSRWMLLAVLLEVVAQAYEHLAEIRDVLPDHFYKWLAFSLPILLAVLRIRAADQQPLTMQRPEKPGAAS